nr:MAG TPA: hypothetical protein [Caudoviricetes sp.]
MTMATPQTIKALVRSGFTTDCPNMRRALTLSKAFSVATDTYRSNPSAENEKDIWIAADRFRCEHGHRVQLRREIMAS